MSQGIRIAGFGTGLLVLVLSLVLAGQAIAAPTVVSTAVSSGTSSSAVLEGEINPGGEAVGYRFEYLPEAAYEANGETFAGATSVPPAEATVGSGSVGVKVTEAISGLAPATAYRFRLLATKEGAVEAEGEAEVFATYAAPTVEPCANDGLRTGYGARLADCRAYEQASPIDKNDGSLQGFVLTSKASVDGEAVSFESAAGIPGGEGSQEIPTYLARRGSGGWTTRGLLPPPSWGSKAEVQGWLPDFSTVYDEAGEIAALGGRAFLGLPTTGGGSAQEVFPYSSTPNLTYSFAGAKPDGSTVLGSANGAVAVLGGPESPPAASSNLYAWSEDEPGLRLVGVLPDGSASPKGAQVGRGAGTYGQDMRAVAEDGSVFSTDSKTGQLYLRQNPTAEETTSKDGNGNCIPDPVLACTMHVSASQRTEGGGPGGRDGAGTRPASFEAATADGSEAFFTSAEKLTDSATVGGPEPLAPSIARSEIDGSAKNLDFLLSAAKDVAVAGEYIYWADPSRDAIGRSKLDGSEFDEEFIAEEEVGGEELPLENPLWIAVDGTHVYWSNNADGNASQPTGSIGWAKLDGTEAEQIVTGVRNAQGVAVDGSHIYWVQFGSTSATRKIGRAALDGSSAEPTFFSLAIGSRPIDVAVDASFVYFTNESNGAVSRVPVGGGSVTSGFITSVGARDGLAVDGEHLYWANQEGDAIGRAKVGGTEPEPEWIKEAGEPFGIAVDASHVYWSAHSSPPPNQGNDLYRFDVGSRALTDLSVDEEAVDPNGADVQGVLGTSRDGSYVYFAANGVLAPNEGAQGTHAEHGDCTVGHDVNGAINLFAGECNLYVWHEDPATHAESMTFIGRLDTDEPHTRTDESDASNWVVGFKVVSGAGRAYQRTARVSDDGRVLLFRSQEQLSAYDNEGLPQLYRYEADQGVICVSCNPTGAPPTAPARLNSAEPWFLAPPAPAQVLTRNLSADGGRIFFESPDPLVAADTNGEAGCPAWGSPVQQAVTRSCQDVYEWEAKGTPGGTCDSEAENGGCLSLVSSGKSDQAAFFLDADKGGRNAFLFTYDQLVGQDRDELMDVYDARVEGGLAGQNRTEPQPCAGEACKPNPAAAPVARVPGSAGFSGPGDPAIGRHHKKHKRAHRKHRRGEKKHGHKKHRKQSGERRHRRDAKATGRAGR